MASEYWEARAREADKYQKNLEDLSAKEVNKIINELEVYIEKEIEKFYRKYAENLRTDEGLSLNQFATGLLRGKELTEWKKEISKTLENLKNEGYSVTNAQKALKNRLRITREEALLQDFQNQATLNSQKEVNNMKNNLENVAKFKEDFDKFALSQNFGYYISFENLSKQEIDTVVSQKYFEKNYSERIWDNRDSLVTKLNTEIRRNFLIGASIETLSTEISKTFNTTRKNAERLIRTESAVVSSEVDKIMYEDAGVENFEFLATMDAKTCPICGELDGKIFEIKVKESGINSNPLHANCRCTTVPSVDMANYDEARLAKDFDGNYVTIPKSWDYAKWKQNYSKLNAAKSTKNTSKIFTYMDGGEA